ncbi:HTH-type transcriptional repressor CytR [Jannaschia aquimarina]|uniref:CytR_1 protein n=1 Tax=Jannaschia aquimarina TaxID=935700 RepID=A0A0D1EKU9_9RHOB|nr:HTH-type transcriptional repressor CytR [Jannaschia aquimarina]SNS83491.1 LacI family transcriptional regulator [Jannaschia aquimarina]
MTLPDPPGATASDQVAIGVLRAARDLGVEVPRDLSVTGFEDILLADLVVPRLTTIRQPVASLARNAVDRVVDGRFKEGATIVPGELIVRGLSGPAKVSPVRDAATEAT